MNGIVNIFKFIFVVEIMLAHIFTNFHRDNITLFSGAFIFVEWFYIFSGYTVAKKVLTSEKSYTIANNTFDIIWKRIMKLFPYYLLSCIIALITKVCTGEVIIEESWDVYRIIYNILFMQMIGISEINLLGTQWFLSSMWISMIIIVPLLLKYRHRFSKLCILLSIVLYYYIYTENGYLHGPVEWLTLGYKGNLRAIAALCMGISMYDYSSAISFDAISKTCEWIINIIVIGIYGGILYYVSKAWVYESWTELSYFIIPFIFAIVISIQMKSKDIFNNKVTAFLGRLSMIIYMNHYYLQVAIQRQFDGIWSFEKKVEVSIIVSLAVSLSIYMIIAIYNKVTLKNVKRK